MQTTPIFKRKKNTKKKKREERTEDMPDHAVYRQQQGVMGQRKAGAPPLQKLSQEEASESLGGVSFGVELDGSPGGSYSTPRAHPV